MLLQTTLKKVTLILTLRHYRHFRMSWYVKTLLLKFHTSWWNHSYSEERFGSPDHRIQSSCPKHPLQAFKTSSSHLHSPGHAFLSTPLSDFSPYTYQTKLKEANGNRSPSTCHFQVKMESIHTVSITLPPSNTFSVLYWLLTYTHL